MNIRKWQQTYVINWIAVSGKILGTQSNFVSAATMNCTCNSHDRRRKMFGAAMEKLCTAISQIIRSPTKNNIPNIVISRLCNIQQVFDIWVIHADFHECCIYWHDRKFKKKLWKMFFSNAKQENILMKKKSFSKKKERCPLGFKTNE